MADKKEAFLLSINRYLERKVFLNKLRRDVNLVKQSLKEAPLSEIDLNKIARLEAAEECDEVCCYFDCKNGIHNCCTG